MRYLLMFFSFLMMLLVGCSNSSKYVEVVHESVLHESFQLNEKGEKHGVYRAFYENGFDSVMAMYKNGVLDGVKIHYNKDGTVLKIQQFVKGLLEYKTITFSRGELNQIASFHKDKFMGVNYLFYENGMLEKIYYAQDSVAQGAQYSFYNNGILGRYDYIHRSEVIFSQKYNPSGKLIEREGYTIGGIMGFDDGMCGDSLIFEFVQPPGTENFVSVIEFNNYASDTIFSAANLSAYAYVVNDSLKNVKITARVFDEYLNESFESEIVLNLKEGI